MWNEYPYIEMLLLSKPGRRRLRRLRRRPAQSLPPNPASSKEPLVKAHYDANMGTFICGSAHRICVWDG